MFDGFMGEIFATGAMVGAVVGLEAGKTAVFALGTGVEPVAVGVEAIFDEVVVPGEVF